MLTLSGRMQHYNVCEQSSEPWMVMGTSRLDSMQIGHQLQFLFYWLSFGLVVFNVKSCVVLVKDLAQVYA